MKTYKSFGALAREFERNLLRLDARYEITMAECAVAVEATAKGMFGHYPDEPSWPQLSDMTMEHHAEVISQGRAAPDAGVNTPLLLTGALRDSVAHQSSQYEFVVGSPSKIMVDMELGTSRIPARPVLAPSLYHNIPTITAALGTMIESTLAGEK